MPFKDIKEEENLLAILDWIDCDKRRKEMARPIMASEIEMKLSFLEWLDEPVFGKESLTQKILFNVLK